MLLDNWYYLLEGGIPKHTCNEIIRYGNSLELGEGITGGSDYIFDDEDKDQHTKNVRNSRTSWICEPWMYNLLTPITDNCNNLGFHFHISEREPVQFTEYKPNGHYNWHQDTTDVDVERGQYKQNTKLMRKLSMIIQLSDPNDYEGGGLSFNLRGLDSRTEDTIIDVPKRFRTQGSVVIFPSYLWHKINTITDGTRYSLVMWSLGEPWK